MNIFFFLIFHRQVYKSPPAWGHIQAHIGPRPYTIWIVPSSSMKGLDRPNMGQIKQSQSTLHYYHLAYLMSLPPIVCLLRLLRITYMIIIHIKLLTKIWNWETLCNSHKLTTKDIELDPKDGVLTIGSDTEHQ